MRAALLQAARLSQPEATEAKMVERTRQPNSCLFCKTQPRLQANRKPQPRKHHIHLHHHVPQTATNLERTCMPVHTWLGGSSKLGHPAHLRRLVDGLDGHAPLLADAAVQDAAALYGERERLAHVGLEGVRRVPLKGHRRAVRRVLPVSGAAPSTHQPSTGRHCTPGSRPHSPLLHAWHVPNLCGKRDIGSPMGYHLSMRVCFATSSSTVIRAPAEFCTTLSSSVRNVQRGWEDVIHACARSGRPPCMQAVFS